MEKFIHLLSYDRACCLQIFLKFCRNFLYTKAVHVIQCDPLELSNRWLDGRDLIPRIQDIKDEAVNDLNLRIAKILKKTPMEEDDRQNLVHAVDTAAGKVVNKLIFGLRDSLNQEIFLECVAGLEKIYEE